MDKTTITFYSPVLRVNNRDVNISFYQDTLGMKLLTEENALAIFGDWSQSDSHFVIEESPAARTRAVQGPKKLNQLVLKVERPEEISSLLARGIAYSKLYKGTNGYAFEALSPENDGFLVHAEEDLASLVEVENFEGQGDKSFKGLSSYKVEQIVLNVPDKAKSQAFYDALSPYLPVSIKFEEASGPDLTIAPNIAWDLEILEFKVGKEANLAQLKVDLFSQGQDVYLDQKENVLVISDPSQIEIWFRK